MKGEAKTVLPSVMGHEASGVVAEVGEVSHALSRAIT